jgi:tetrahedral aminopeptidase
MELLMQLLDLNGPSGAEHNVRALITKEIKNYVDEISIDKMGNIVAHHKGNGSRVMLAAHMDEIGLMVKNINDNGFIEFTTVGSIEPITLIGQSVSIIDRKNNECCKGIISFKKLHNDDVIKKIPSIHEMYVDTGLSKKELKNKGIDIGNYIIPKHKSNYLGSKKIISGKALDDRVGCYILIKVIQMLKKSRLDAYYVFTVQEEVGLYGAKAAVYNINPDWGLAVDTTNCADADTANIFGKGPFITIKDSELITNMCLDDWLKAIAKKKKIAYQLEVSDIGTTDATNIMLSRGGVPSTVVAVPIRNLHSTIGIAHEDDINNAILLLYYLLKYPPKVCIT